MAKDTKMKTIEEINEIAPYHPLEWQQGYGIWQAGYMEGQKNGVTEQKAIDEEIYTEEMWKLNEEWEENLKLQRELFITKTCEWLKANTDNYYKSSSQADDCFFDTDEMVEAFRKAMEDK